MTLIGEAHRRLDLDARQARGFGARENARQALLERLLDLAARRSGLDACEAAFLAVVRQRLGQHVGGQVRQLLAALHDRDELGYHTARVNGAAAAPLDKDS